MTTDSGIDFSQAPFYSTVIGEDAAGAAILSAPFRAVRVDGQLVIEGGGVLPNAVMAAKGVRCTPDGAPVAPLAAPPAIQARFLADFAQAHPGTDLAGHASDIEALRSRQPRKPKEPRDCGDVLKRIEREIGVPTRDWAKVYMGPGASYTQMEIIGAKIIQDSLGVSTKFHDMRVLGLKPSLDDKAEEIASRLRATGAARSLQPYVHPRMPYHTNEPLVAVEDGIALLHFTDRDGQSNTIAWVAEAELVAALEKLPAVEPPRAATRG